MASSDYISGGTTYNQNLKEATVHSSLQTPATLATRVFHVTRASSASSLIVFATSVAPNLVLGVGVATSGRNRRSTAQVTTPEKWDGISRHWQHRACRSHRVERVVDTGDTGDVHRGSGSAESESSVVYIGGGRNEGAESDGEGG